MRAWLVLIPVITALAGWLMNRVALYFVFYPIAPKRVAGFRIQGLLPRKQQQIARNIACMAVNNLISFDTLSSAITDPNNFRKILPSIESHIDDFLKVKLKKSMPVVGMFIGDKTTEQLKTVFLNELESIFPVVMKSYANNLQQELDVEQLILDKLLAISPVTMVQYTRSTLKKELSNTGLFGAVTGFICGLIALLLVWIA